MPLRVVLMGAESTGKSTLAQALAAYYHTVWAPEYLRLFVDHKGALPTPEDSRHIANGHLAQQATLLGKANRVLFLDTDLVTTCVYHRYYFGSSPSWLLEQSHVHAGDLYLFTDTDIPWVADEGQRDSPAVRRVLHGWLRQEIVARRLPHVVISGARETRLMAAIRVVDRLLQEL